MSKVNILPEKIEKTRATDSGAQNDNNILFRDVINELIDYLRAKEEENTTFEIGGTGLHNYPPKEKGLEDLLEKYVQARVAESVHSYDIEFVAIHEKERQEILQKIKDMIQDADHRGYVQGVEKMMKIEDERPSTLKKIKEAKREMIEKIEGMRRECLNHGNGVECYGYDEAHNRTLDDILSAIKK